MDNIGDYNLSQSQINFICGAINWHGDSEHPVADSQTLKYFKTSYVKEIFSRTSLLQALSTTGKEMLETINAVLNK